MSNKKQSTDLVTYRGKVNAQVRKGKKVISTSTFHNEGTKYLFEFLAKCLKGDYQQVESLRPKFIKLYSVGAEGDSIPEINSGSFNTTSIVSLTTPIYSANPNTEYVGADDDLTASYATTFKFVIPFSQLMLIKKIDGEEQKVPVNLIALYSQYQKNTLGSPSMYILVTEKVNNVEVLGNLIPSNFYSSDLSEQNQYNLFIEWITTFKNEGDQ